MSDWQPIETAPRDGTVIMARNKKLSCYKVYYVYCDFWDRPIGMGSNDLEADGFISDVEWCGFYDLDDHGPYVGLIEWTPPPEAPK